MPRCGAGGGEGWRSCADEGFGDSAVWTISPREKDDAPRRENFPSRGALSISACRGRLGRRRSEERLVPARECRSGTGVVIRLRKGASLAPVFHAGSFFASVKAESGRIRKALDSRRRALHGVLRTPARLPATTGFPS